jgi:hypothetical protein
MYRLIDPGDRQELPLRMLFHPLGEGVYLKACEADSSSGLVAALLHDPAYEGAGPQSRLVERVRMANDIALLAGMDGRQVLVADRDAPNSVNVHSDEQFIRALHRLGVVSLAPSPTTRSHALE